MKQLRKYTRYPQGVASHKDLLDYILNKAKDLKIVSYNTVDNRVGYVDVDTNVDTNVDTTPDTTIPFYFENVGTANAVISVKKNNNNANTASLEISTDNKNWETWGSTSTTALSKTIGAGERLYIRNAEDVGYVNTSYYNYFSSTGANIIIGGNIMSLGYKNFDGKYTIEQPYAYQYLFYNMLKLVDASRLILPATTLANYCYNYMFSDCTSLTTAPELPATTLADRCYNSMFNGCSKLTTTPALPAETLASWCYSEMFRGCTSLTTAPELPATTLASYCYNSMFWGCTSLTTAPELPATTLADRCYATMFSNCISLTKAPVLPATTLVQSCYSSMFYGCSNLNYIKAMFTTAPSKSYTSDWVNGVASTGTFVKNANATWDASSVNSIPNGWTVETATE